MHGGLPVVLCGHPHMPLQYRKRMSASERVCELLFGVLSKKKQQKKPDSYLTSVLPKSFLCSYLLPNDDQFSLTYLAAQSEVVHSLVRMLFNPILPRGGQNTPPYSFSSTILKRLKISS